MTVDPEHSQRLAAALRAAGTDARPREDCPTAERLWSAVHLKLTIDERLRVIDHTTECPSCAEAWRLAMEIERKDSMAAGALTTPVRGRWRPGAWIGVAAAIGLVAVATALVVVVKWRTPDAPVVRDGTAEAIYSLVREDASLPRQEFWLRWSGSPPGTRYDLVVTTVSLEVIADVRDLERPEYRVDPNRLAALAPGARVLWRVVGRTPEGRTLSSATFSVTVQ